MKLLNVWATYEKILKQFHKNMNEKTEDGNKMTYFLTYFVTQAEFQVGSDFDEYATS